MHERTQRKTIYSPKSAAPKRFSINLNKYNKRYLQSRPSAEKFPGGSGGQRKKDQKIAKKTEK